MNRAGVLLLVVKLKLQNIFSKGHLSLKFTKITLLELVNVPADYSLETDNFLESSARCQHSKTHLGNLQRGAEGKRMQSARL